MPKGGAEGCSWGPTHDSEVSEQVCQRHCKQQRENNTNKKKINSSKEKVQRSGRSCIVGPIGLSRRVRVRAPSGERLALTRKHGTATAAQRPPTALVMRWGRVHVAFRNRNQR